MGKTKAVLQADGPSCAKGQGGRGHGLPERLKVSMTFTNKARETGEL